MGERGSVLGAAALRVLLSALSWVWVPESLPKNLKGVLKAFPSSFPWEGTKGPPQTWHCPSSFSTGAAQGNHPC